MPTRPRSTPRGHRPLLYWARASSAAAVLLVTSLLPASAGPLDGTPYKRVWPELPVTAMAEHLQLGNNSPAVLSDPEDSRFVVLANRLDNPDFDCALHLSGDGGRLWVPVRPVPVLPPGADKCYAPEVAFDRRGTLYYLFIALHGQGNSPSGTYLVTSRDRGRTFSAPQEVLGPERYMVRMAVDRTVGSVGRLHLVWLQATSDPPLGGLGPPPNPIMAKYSDDGGRTFSTPVQVSDPGRQRVVAPTLALGAEGHVHVLYYDLQDDARDYQGLEGPTWDGHWSLVLATSTDGGRSFTNSTVDEELIPPERVMLIYTMPPPALAVADGGQVFAGWYDARFGDWDVFLRRSADHGRTWSPVRRLNDDTQGNGRHQYLPRLAAAPGGRIDALFYDRRDDDGNVLNHVYVTSSEDGGQSFTANVRVTSESFSSQIGTRYPIVSARGLVEYGSRLGLLSNRSTILAAWTDTRNQDTDSFGQDVFATRVDLATTDRPARRWPTVGLALLGGAVVVGVVAWRRRRARRVPAGPVN